MKRERVSNIFWVGERLIVALSFYLTLSLISIGEISAQGAQGATRTVIRGGQIVPVEVIEAEVAAAVAEVEQSEVEMESEAEAEEAETEETAEVDDSQSSIISTQHSEDMSADDMPSVSLASESAEDDGAQKEKKERKPLFGKEKFFSDSMSLSSMAWKATAIPGYGQIYNKQYWKLPILYAGLGGGLTLFFLENKKYKPLKAEYDILSIDLYRSDELNTVQAEMIRSNTRRQIYLGATVATFVSFLADATLNYSTNEVSDIKRATTLAMICPGAGQLYNKSYWKVPIVLGGFGTLIYVIDWNNRGYQRFKTAYSLTYGYENGTYDEPVDEFGGQYSATYLKSIRQTYRRARDLSIIMLAGLYILQVVDAHVDAHFKDYDISDNLSVSIEPTVSNVYAPNTGRTNPSYGFSIAGRF